MTVPPVLLSVNVGMPKNVAWQGKTVYTGVWKRPVDGPAMVRRLNIDGDGQGDLAGHGGEQRAVLVYQVQSYQHWRRHFGRDDLGYGQFGENLTVDGLTDDEVCIGDRYRIGEAEFEVTQPRVTCYRVGMRMGEPELPALLVSHHRPGFYMRVITEGRIQAGDRIVKIRSGPGALSVADTDALLYLPGRDRTKLRAAVRIPALSPGWQQSFRDLLAEDDGHPAGTPAWAGFRPLRVTKVVPESATVSSIYLTAPDTSPLPPARAGQYLTLRVGGAGQPAPVRSYSLSSAPGAGAYRISVKREAARRRQPLPERQAAAGGDPRADRPQADHQPHQPPGPPGTGPMVTFARSGIATRFGAAGRSLLELADACDVPTRWSCRSGVCHTCTTPLLSGSVSYAPDPLEPRPMERCSSAAPGPATTSCWICESHDDTTAGRRPRRGRCQPGHRPAARHLRPASTGQRPAQHQPALARRRPGRPPPCRSDRRNNVRYTS